MFMPSNVEEGQLLMRQPKRQNARGQSSSIVACSYVPNQAANFSLAAGLPVDEHIAQMCQDNFCNTAPKLTDIFGMPACQQEAQASGTPFEDGLSTCSTTCDEDVGNGHLATQ